MKINKKLLCITSLVICLPILVGLLVWKQLPAQIPTHFGISGQADGYSSKFEAVVILPLILLVMHIFTVVLTVISPKSANVGSKMLQVIYWMIPAVALVVQLSTLVVALGYLNSPSVLIVASISLLFMVIGNYLPKIHQNYIVGIKLPWTLYDEKNWNQTHRLAGKVWVICGGLSFVTSFIPLIAPYVFMASVVVMVLVPVVYSYRMSKKKPS